MQSILAGYIEQAGTGTLDMMQFCRQYGLSQPGFRQEGDFFVQTMWRDWLTEASMRAWNLNDRQVAALLALKINGRITNKEYQELAHCNDRTALRDLDELASNGIIVRHGKTGRNTFYSIGFKPSLPETRHKPDIAPRKKSPQRGDN